MRENGRDRSHSDIIMTSTHNWAEIEDLREHRRGVSSCRRSEVCTGTGGRHEAANAVAAILKQTRRRRRRRRSGRELIFWLATLFGYLWGAIVQTTTAESVVVQNGRGTIHLAEAPELMSKSATATFHFLMLGDDNNSATFMCSLDGGNPEGCASQITYANVEDGNHSFRVTGTDAAGHQAELSYDWEVDSPPVVSLQNMPLSRKQKEQSLVLVRAEWSEPVRQFSIDDISIRGVEGKVLSFSLAQTALPGSVFEFLIHPLGDGTMRIEIDSGVCTDTGGNPNKAAKPLVLQVDTTSPQALFSKPVYLGYGKYEVKATFSETIVDFSPEKIQATGMPVSVSASPIQGASNNEVVLLISTVSSNPVGVLTLSLEEGAAKDRYENPSEKTMDVLTLEVSSGDLFIFDETRSVVRAVSVPIDLSSESGHKLRTDDFISKNDVDSNVMVVDDDASLLLVTSDKTTIAVYSPRGILNLTIGGFGRVSAIDIGPDGSLYVADEEKKSILTYAEELEAWTPILTLDNGAHDNVLAQKMSSIAVDSKSNVYVLDSKAKVISAFNKHGLYIGSTGLDGLVNPTKIVVDGAGRLFVLDRDQAIVRALAADSIGADANHLIDIFHNSLKKPVSLAIGSIGALYVGDAASGNIFVFSTKTFTLEDRITGNTGIPSALTVNRDRKPLRCTLLEPSDTQVGGGVTELTAACNKPVDVLPPTAIELGGISSNIKEISAPTYSEDGQVNFQILIEPQGSGVVTVKIVAGGVTDINGNVSAEDSNQVKIEQLGGTCAADLQCQWQLSHFEHQLAQQRAEQQVEFEELKAERLMARQEAFDRRKMAVETIADEERHKRQIEADLKRIEMEREMIPLRAKEEADNRIREAKENESLRLNELRMQAESKRQMVADTVSTLLASTGAVLSDEKELIKLVSVLMAIFFAFFLTKELSSAIRYIFESIYGKPSLLRERSSPFKALVDMVQKKSLLEGVVLSPKLQERMKRLTSTISGTRRHGMALRNVIFYGPPGTGKTLAAERLAHRSGLDYAIMTGGDVAPLGSAAVTEIHKVFRWAKRSRRGVLLFIDEADAFLHTRDSCDGVRISETLRASLNALLYHTGTQSDRFMVVLASNRLDHIDAAVLNRMDDMVEFGLPGLQERQKILESHFARFIGDVPSKNVTCNGRPVQAWSQAFPGISIETKASINLRRNTLPVTLKGFSAETFKEVAEKTEGLSGRELSKICSALQAYVFSDVKGSPRLSTKDFFDVVEMKVSENRAKTGNFIKQAPLSPN